MGKLGINSTRRKNLLGPTRKCHRQVVDLMRLCLVFGLPLPRLRNVGENGFYEPVPQTPRSETPWSETPRSDDLAVVADHVAGRALDGGVRSSGQSAK